jgi:hypothetical protein
MPNPFATPSLPPSSPINLPPRPAFAHLVDKNVIETVASCSPIIAGSKWTVKIFPNPEATSIFVLADDRQYWFKQIGGRSRLVESSNRGGGRYGKAPAYISSAVAWNIYRAISDPKMGPTLPYFTIKFGRQDDTKSSNRDAIRVVVDCDPFGGVYWGGFVFDKVGKMIYAIPAM